MLPQVSEAIFTCVEDVGQEEAFGLGLQSTFLTVQFDQTQAS